jgi:phage baseplate assembly protein W
MAFGEKTIPLIEQQPKRGVGIGLPFNIQGVFRTTYTTKDSLRNNLINYILTEPGEIIFDPERGAGLQKYIFEQNTNTNTENIQDYLITKINRQFPNLEVQVRVVALEDLNTVNIEIRYRMQGTDITDTINISLANGQ